ncbi:MAG: RHS repeat-associated core domain-containing protein [Saprospiraceae bacterium]|nr:RHS repeat-associated core domain-containing protein [Saprospiraceae bacterium]
MDYFPYGKILRQFIKTPEKYVTTGHERDVETGLDYRGARFYDADACRFLSLDPHAVNYLSWSAYHYVAANPILVTDPTGKDWEITKSTTTDEDGYTTTTYTIKVNMAILNLDFG